MSKVEKTGHQSTSSSVRGDSLANAYAVVTLDDVFMQHEVVCVCLFVRWRLGWKTRDAR